MREVNANNLVVNKKLALNAVYSLIGLSLPMLIGLISIPILIRHIGVERFGILTLAWLVISYFSLFDLGLGRALTQLVAEKIGKGESNKSIAELTWTTSLLMLFFGILGAIVFASLTPWMVEKVLNIPTALKTETTITFYILAFSIPIVISSAGLVGFMSAFQRFDLINIVRSPLGIYMFLGPLAVLPFSRSLPTIVGVLLVGRIAGWVTYILFCVRVMPNLFSDKSFNGRQLLPLLRFGGWMTITNIIGPLLVYIDRFLIGSLISVTAVSYYATPYELITKLWIIPGAVVSVLFPAFSTSFNHNPKHTEKIFYRGIKYIFIILFPITLTITVFAHELLAMWLGDKFAENSTSVLQFLAIGVFINSLSQIPFALIQGIGRPDITAKFHFVELPLYLSLLLNLTSSFGISGAAGAWLIRVIIDTVLLFLIARTLLPKDLEIPKFKVMASITSVVFIIVIALFNFSQPVKTVLLAMLMIGYITLSWFSYLSFNERISIVKFIQFTEPKKDHK